MQNKTLLKRLVGLVAVVCLALAMVFGLVGCGESEPTVKQTSVQGNKIVVELTDGTKTSYTIDGITDVKTAANGKIELTYANGSKVTMNYSACANHDFTAPATVKPASCYEEGVAIKVCKTCGFVESVSVAKNPEIHGQWVISSEVVEGDLEIEETNNGIVTYTREDTGYSWYVLETQYVYGSMTTLEAYSGVAEKCFEAECALCGERFEDGHAPVEDWEDIPWDDRVLNVCENEHVVVKACPICHAVFLYDDGTYGYTKTNKLLVESVPATGHNYSVELGEKLTQYDPAMYQVILTCETCNKVQIVNAKLINTVEPTCKTSVSKYADAAHDGEGYSVYEYTYANYVDGEYKTNLVGTIEADFVERSEIHTVQDEDATQYEAYTVEKEGYYVEQEYNEALFNSGLLRWSEGEGEAANCKSTKPAVFDCAICGEVIVVKMQGPHSYSEETEYDVTCTTDGYTEKFCELCGDVVIEITEEAQGHKWAYVEGSYKAKTDTASAKADIQCSVCNQKVTKNAILDTEAANCKAQDKYYVMANKGREGDQDYQIPFPVNAAVLRHTIEGVSGTFIANGTYEYSAVGATAFENQKIAWKDEKGDCENEKGAKFTCSTCGEPIEINLYGDHVLSTEPDKTNVYEVTCTSRGYTETLCTKCEEYIELPETRIAPKGHNFIADQTEYVDFRNDPTDGGQITYICINEGCDAQVVLTAYESGPEYYDGKCMDTNTYTYHFYDGDTDEAYKYDVEDALGNYYTKTFEPAAIIIVETEGAHRLGTEQNGVDVIAFNIYDSEANIYPYNDYRNIGRFFADGTLRWNEGTAAKCTERALAVFTCIRCDERVVIQVNGPHAYKEDFNGMNEEEIAAYKVVVDPTCTEDGYTKQLCLVCNEWITTATTEALDHDLLTWTNKVDGELFAEAYFYNGEVYLNQQTLKLGYSECACERCGDLFYATAEILDVELPTCGKDGTLTIGYRYNNRLVGQTVTIKIDKLEEHITELLDAEAVVKAYDNLKNEYTLSYYCLGCEQFVVVYRGNETYINNIIKNVLGINNVNVIG